jgi:hypothetical protein
VARRRARPARGTARCRPLWPDRKPCGPLCGLPLDGAAITEAVAEILLQNG